MSTFKVKLTNPSQGTLDTSVVGGKSNQRTIFAPGPNKASRKLKDGDTFTDCNYWKRFAAPQLPLDQAFIEVVTDDGSTYSDIPSENVFGKAYMNVPIAGGSVFTDNVIDILGDTGGFAVFTQITPSVAMKVRINGQASSILDLSASVTQIFNPGDLTIGKLEFDNSASGASSGVVDVFVSVRSVCNS